VGASAGAAGVGALAGAAGMGAPAGAAGVVPAEAPGVDGAAGAAHGSCDRVVPAATAVAA